MIEDQKITTANSEIELTVNSSVNIGTASLPTVFEPDAKITMTYEELTNLIQEREKMVAEQMTTSFSEHMQPFMVKAFGQMQRTRDAVEFHPENHSTIVPATGIHETWLWFLQELATVRLSNSLTAAEAPAALDVIANLFLPALVYIKLVSIFDEALEFYINANRSTLPGGYQTTLHGKLSFLDGKDGFQYTQTIRDIKNKRNDIGHLPTNPGNWQAQQVGWQELEKAIDDIEFVLQQLGIVGPRPTYETFGERLSETVPDDKPEVFMIHTYNYGLKENGKVILNFSHTWEYLRLPIE